MTPEARSEKPYASLSTRQLYIHVYFQALALVLRTVTIRAPLELSNSGFGMTMATTPKSETAARMLVGVVQRVGTWIKRTHCRTMSTGDDWNSLWFQFFVLMV